MKNKYNCEDCNVSRIIDTNLCPECLEIDFTNPYSLMDIADDLNVGLLTIDPRMNIAVYGSTVSWAKKKRCKKILYTKKIAAFCARMNGDEECFVEVKSIFGDTLVRYNNNIAVFSDTR